MPIEKIKKGGSGSELNIREWTYTKRTVGSHSIYLTRKNLLPER